MRYKVDKQLFSALFLFFLLFFFFRDFLYASKRPKITHLYTSIVL